MRRVWIMPVAALAAGMAAFAGARLAAPRGSAPLDRLRDPSILARELGLNPGQRAAVEALHIRLAGELAQICERHCRACSRIGDALAADTLDEARADALIGDLQQAYAQSERATLDHILRVRALLDTDQRRRLDRMIIENLCLPCPACAAGGDGEQHGG